MKTDRIAPLYADPGPFASVYLDVSQDMEDGNHRVELAVRGACDALAEQGAPAPVVDQVREQLGASTHRSAPVSRLVVATERGVLLDELTRSRTEQPTAVWDALPDVAAWIEAEDGGIPFVLALVDHEGGDVSVHRTDPVVPDQQESVGKSDPYENKVAGGAWSELQFQRVAETVWARNARAVTEAVEREVRGGIRLVLLAGDVHSCRAVKDELGPSLQAEVVQLETGTRAADGGDAALQSAIREALAGQAVAAQMTELHELRQRLGRDEAVATGVGDVIDALVRGQVERLLIDAERAAEFTVEPEHHPGLSLGAITDPPAAIRADRALVAGAALTGAEVVAARTSTLGGAPAAALLRWDQPSEGARA